MVRSTGLANIVVLISNARGNEFFWVDESTPFYERTMSKIVYHLHNQGLGRGLFPVDLSSEVFDTWCSRIDTELRAAKSPWSAASHDRASVLRLRSPADVGIVVMTASMFEETRMRYINNTWARRFPKLVYAVGEDFEGQGYRVERITPPRAFLYVLGDQGVDSYFSHVFKGHSGLDRFFRRTPHLPWYGLVSDDSYVFDAFLLEFLREASANPAEDAVCAGHLQRQPKEAHWASMVRMFRHCEHVAPPGFEVDMCREWVGRMRLPYVNVTYIHGAGIFCTNAALVLLQPHLSTVLSTEVFDSHGREFRDFMQPADELMGRCIAELGIRMVDMHGYFAGSHIPGDFPSSRLQHPEYREGFTPFQMGSALRPALWHEIKGLGQFDALEYFYSVVRQVEYSQIDV